MRHRVNSASTLSVRSAGSRLSTSRVSTKPKQRPITGRPSSAPVSILKSQQKKKKIDQDLGNGLQVIGKAIQTPVRTVHGPSIRNRAALRVLSSRRHFIPLSQREQIASFLAVPHNLRNISRRGFSADSSESENNSQPSIMSYHSDHGNIMENRGPRNSVNDTSETFCTNKSKERSYCGYQFENTHAFGETDSFHSYYTSDETECIDVSQNIRYPFTMEETSACARDKHEHYYHIDTSNSEDSDGTVTSLGQKIKTLAQQNSIDTKMDNNPIELENSGDRWDEEWHHLIQNNHNLLLKLTDDENLDTSTDAEKLKSYNEPNKTDNDLKLYETTDGAQLTKETIVPQETEHELGSLKRAMDMLTTVGDEQILQPIDECGESSLSSSSISKKSIDDKPPVAKIPSPKEAWSCEATTTNKEPPNNVNKPSEVNLIDFESTSPTVEPFNCPPVIYRTSFPILDQLCKPGSQTEQFKCISDSVNQTTSDRIPKNNTYACKQRPSEGLLEAIKMLDENAKMKDCYEENESSQIQNKELLQCLEASDPVRLHVLSEKLKLFATDIYDAWNNKTEKLGEDEQEKWLENCLKAEEILDEICIKESVKINPEVAPSLHKKCEDTLSEKQKEFENRIQKNLELIRKLLDDKKTLAEKCEKYVTEISQLERKHTNNLKQVDVRHNQELEDLKQKLKVDDQVKREKWSQQKTKFIKDSTYRSLENKMKEMETKHRDELSKLKDEYWRQLRDYEDLSAKKLRELEDELKSKYEKERNEALSREKDRERERYEHELKQSDMVWESRLETSEKQALRSRTEIEEEHARTKNRIKSDHEDQLRAIRRELENAKVEYDERIRNAARNHEKELNNLKKLNENSQMDWRDTILKEYEETRHKTEKELRDKLRRQRDKEIEKAVREMQQEMALRLEEQHRMSETKIKNLRERYESEMRDLESSERTARTKYLEFKGLLAQREEEIVYMRARMHTQNLELSDLQQMIQGPNS